MEKWHYDLTSLPMLGLPKLIASNIAYCVNQIKIQLENIYIKGGPSEITSKKQKKD
jgi:hypothetical protein